MQDPRQVAATIEKTFTRIHLENMQGIPILNPAIEVQAVGFQHYQGRVLGVIITPWLMNVVILPAEDENWSNMELGHKQPHKFPSKTCKFMVNHIEGIGACQTHSLYSPMRDFACHEQALKMAHDFLETLMVDSEPTAEDMVDEELLGRVMRGEDTPEINLDDFAVIEPMQVESSTVSKQGSTPPKARKNISRRNLLRGNLR
ncbi:MAG: [NiFe]-hydrogenase assembly chaperone HybE [Gammaproteobacteria bacterium]|nr:[NiFe]-hydrogenase assembly chaperone HybE [Gammaproteobacteria bacterium]